MVGDFSARTERQRDSPPKLVLKMNIDLLKDGLRIFRRSIKVKSKGIRRYDGNAEEICKQIVESCWNGEYFQVSQGHFCQFYIRDFGWCVDSLLKLGYKDEVKKTLEYALKKYSKQKLTTTITPNGKCVDVFSYSPDSLAFLIRSLKVAGADDLVEKYKTFLVREIRKFESIMEGGLITTKKHFSSMKDQSLRKSATYDNVMAAMLARDLEQLGFKSLLDFKYIKNRIKEELWNGSYFYDDLSKKKIVTGDANVFAFWTEVFTDKEMMKKSFAAIQKAGLDKPFPLKYTKSDSEKKNFVGDFLTNNYEGNSIWMHMGLLYVSLIHKVDKKKAEEYIKKYTENIDKNRNFLEVFNSQGKPYKSLFYYTDESMSWACNYLTLLDAKSNDKRNN